MDHLVPLVAQMPQHLRSLRKARGLTQLRLAQVLGVSQSRVAQIERNPAAISVDQLFKILAALDVQLLLRDERDGARKATVRAASPPQPPAGSDPNRPQGAW